VKQKRKSTINRPCCFMSKMDFMKIWDWKS
jgi:hypothetical protein